MSALRDPPTLPALTPEDVAFLREVASDTEDAPWMSMNDPQWRSASALFWSLEVYALNHGRPWYPGGMLPLTWRPPGRRRRKQVAPDVFAAPSAVEGRPSWPIEVLGMPPFVLEVVSPSSVEHDLTEKTELYRILGAEEYAIVRLDLAEARLEGFRRDGRGAWVPWLPDRTGQLWSAVLGLGLVLRDGEVRAVTRQGELLRTPAEAEAARGAAEAAREDEAQARRQAEAAREAAEAARAAAEEEVARLRAALEQRTKDADETVQ